MVDNVYTKYYKKKLVTIRSPSQPTMTMKIEWTEKLLSHHIADCRSNLFLLYEVKNETETNLSSASHRTRFSLFFDSPDMYTVHTAHHMPTGISWFDKEMLGDHVSEMKIEWIQAELR